MFQGNIGAGSSANDVPITPVSVQPGATVTVANTAASATTVTYYTSLEATSAGTITAGNNVAFTSGPVWLQVPSGVASIQITGTGY